MLETRRHGERTVSNRLCLCAHFNAKKQHVGIIFSHKLQGAQYPRIFVWGHFSQGTIIPAGVRQSIISNLDHEGATVKLSTS